MPELPEIEHLRRGLSSALTGQRIKSAHLARADYCHTLDGTAPTPRGLLTNARLVRFDRLGKQLAMVAADGRVACVHLGMSGQLIHLPDGPTSDAWDHVHVWWAMEDSSRLVFRDPRRFGGLWLFASMDELRAARWSALGPDAITARSSDLRIRLGASSRAIKAALLDQRAVAGVGNIYADEALFRAGLHPLRACSGLSGDEWTKLARCVREVLREAVRAGGSTLRDYRDSAGNSGQFQMRHRVYGRTGEPCPRCRGGEIVRLVISQRSSHFCPSCQPAKG